MQVKGMPETTEIGKRSLFSITVKTILVHTVTYFLMGLIAFTVFDYSGKYADPAFSNYMRQTTHPMVAAGIIFQVMRGLLFALVFYPLQDVIFARKNGWLILWLMLLVVGVFSPFGPSPSSIEGMVYTTIPFEFHLTGLPEVISQSLLLAYFTYFWVNHPEKKWLGWVFGILFFLVISMSILGILASLEILSVPAQ